MTLTADKKVDVLEHKKNVKGHFVKKLSEDGATNQVVTLPNAISLLRILLIPLCIYYLATFHDFAALIVLALCGFSDFLDGFLARKFEQVTKIGKILDPIADRLLIFTMLVMLVWRDFIPIWFVIVVLLRETALFFQYAQLVLHGKDPIPVKFIGKAGAAMLMVLMPLVILFNSSEISFTLFPYPRTKYGVDLLWDIWRTAPLIVWCLMIFAVTIYWIAGVLYCNDAAKILRTEPNKRLIIISGVITIVIASLVTILVLIIAYEPFG